MTITKKCLFNGKTYTMEIPKLTPELLAKVEAPNRPNIQNVVPMLTASEREFLMTGTPPSVWDAMFSR
jgi:hypothetical protein